MYFCKFAYLMTLYDIYEGDVIKKTTQQINKIIEQREKESGRKIIVINDFKLSEVFLNRIESAKYFIKFFTDEEFKRRVKHVGDFTINYPKTFGLGIEKYNKFLEVFKRK